MFNKGVAVIAKCVGRRIRPFTHVADSRPFTATKQYVRYSGEVGS